MMKTLAMLTFLAVASTGLTACGSAVPDASAIDAIEPGRPTAEETPNRRVTVGTDEEVSKFAAAAVENCKLAQEIEWPFGGRVQRGWVLYADLIAHMVGTDGDYASAEFAAAVADWQKKQGIRPADGVVDEQVWQRMMKALQSGRAFDSAEPPASELLETPAAEWYDRGRSPELRMLRRDAFDAYQRMVAEARADLGEAADGYFGIISGYRSAAYQASLRQQAGNPSTAQLAIRSPHFTGRALDIYVGGEPVSTKDTNRAVQVATPAYKWLARNAHRFGFRPYFYEPWHWEYDPRLAATAAKDEAPEKDAKAAKAAKAETKQISTRENLAASEAVRRAMEWLQKSR
jgi:D-alanyl-D-alanine carboxypeptidase